MTDNTLEPANFKISITCQFISLNVEIVVNIYINT
jgi:hypothetical protein